MSERLEVDAYRVFSSFYDQWSAEMTEDVPFYVARALAAGGPVVELGAGQGRVAIPIAQAGRPVIAVEPSDAMRTEGERRAGTAGVADRITWVKGVMQRFVAEPAVELVIIPFRSFLHLLTTREQLAALGSIHASLVPGGRMICNFFTPDPAVIAAYDGVRRHQGEFVDDAGRRCEIWAISRYAVADQGVRLEAGLDVYDGERLVDTITSEMRARMVYRYEFEHLLARTGFEVEALYGGFDERAYGPGPDEMVWVARRP
ncbi:MAG TPA: class I SAM-dependent methyltransferase [Actinomycetota bacterium]